MIVGVIVATKRVIVVCRQQRVAQIGQSPPFSLRAKKNSTGRVETNSFFFAKEHKNRRTNRRADARAVGTTARGSCVAMSTRCMPSRRSSTSAWCAPASASGGSGGSSVLTDTSNECTKNTATISAASTTAASAP